MADIPISLIDIDDIRTGRGGGGKKAWGGKYGKYRDSVRKLIPFFKEQIEKSKDSRGIRMRARDIATEMGPDFLLKENGKGSGKNIGGKHTTSLLWGLKYVLWDEHIVITQGKHKDGSDVFILRTRVEGDVLPESLAKSKAEEAKKGGTAKSV